MIGKIFPKIHGSFKNRIRYIFGCSKHDHAISKILTIDSSCISPDPLPSLLAGNEKAVMELVDEFDQVEKLRNFSIDSDKKIKPVFHAMLSLRPGESLTPQQWQEVVRIYVKDLGFGGTTKYVAVMHQDTDHQHVHIVANRIKLEEGFRMVSDSNERTINIDSMSDIEDKFGLKKAPKPTETWGTAITHAEMEASIKDNSIPFKHKMIAKVAGAVERTQGSGGDMFMFVRLLRRQGVYIHLTKDENGQPKGIAYEHEGKVISGRQLKRSRLTWQKLITQEEIDYEQETLPALEAEIARREDDDQIITTIRTRYYVFVARRRKLPVRFKAQSDEAAAEMVMAILSILLGLFGINFSAMPSQPGRWHQEYVHGRPFNPETPAPHP